MHFFVWILLLLTSILTGALIAGIAYLKSQSSNQALLNQITFSSIDTTFGNGIPGDQLWSTTDVGSQKAILAKLSDLRTFLALAFWDHTTAISDPSLPYYFTLTEPAFSVKTYIAGQEGINFPVGTNTLFGVLLSPTHVGFKFSVLGSSVPTTDHFFTGADVTISSPQELAVIIIYTISP